MKPPIEINPVYQDMNPNNTITFHESLSIKQRQQLLNIYSTAEYFKIICDTKTLIKTRKELEYEHANIIIVLE